MDAIEHYENYVTKLTVVMLLMHNTYGKMLLSNVAIALRIGDDSLWK